MKKMDFKMLKANQYMLSVFLRTAPLIIRIR